MYKIVFSRSASKNFNSIPRNFQKKIFVKITVLEKEPLVGKRLTGKYKGIYSLRAWPYRIIYQINKKYKQVEIIDIIHRQGVYK